MRLRSLPGGVAPKRLLVAIAGGLALAILAALSRAPNRHDVTHRYPASPSSAEESGISETVVMLEPPLRSAPADSHRPQPKIPSVHQSASREARNPQTNPDIPHDLLSDQAGIAEDLVVSSGDLGRLSVLAPHDLEPRLGAESDVEGEQRIVPDPTSQPSDTARTPLLTPPVLLQAGSLRYPADGYRIVVDHSAFAPGIGVGPVEGRVGLRILVHADGSVGDVEVVQSSGNSFLDAAAVREVARWKFAPATRDGQPIDAWALVPLLFVLR